MKSSIDEVKSLAIALADLLAGKPAAEGGGASEIERVTALSLRFGESLALSEVELSELELLAQVHDVGTAWSPADALFKDSTLVADEKASVNRHVITGAELALATPGLERVASLVRHHHERWDGRGYPDGLSGEEIPLACRILAICDAYISMTAGRPYRPAISSDEALREIEACKGTQFDPGLADKFLHIPSHLLLPAREGKAPQDT
jgi:HD-GYP domain-containing protein (c-di-GMP phosphodiesterase class II)